jgi:hypothetical protein
MALDSTHPLYADHAPDWEQLRDAAKGERIVKEKGQKYLPPTSGMLIDGLNGEFKGAGYDPAANNGAGTAGLGNGVFGKYRNMGHAAYEAYKLRAVFPEYVKDALEYFMGALHNKSPVIELPEEMEDLRSNATPLGEPLEILLQRINLEQLTTGRVGILLDLPEKPDPTNPLPFIALYVAEAIRNWDDTTDEDTRDALNLVVLDESGMARGDDFEWKTVRKYRVLQLGELDVNEANGTADYKTGLFTSDSGSPDYDPSVMKIPSLRGNTLEAIPFQFINTKDISPEPDEPPLMSLCRQCFTIYRGEADYRQNLFMQGQDTLVVIGARQSNRLPGETTVEEPLRTGAGARIDLELTGDAKYVGVNSQGLAEQRTALENDRKRCEARSGQLIDASQGDKESGAALKTRVGAQTATLNQIAKTAALALELLLKQCAVWMKADPEKVKVTPNLEFADYQMAGQDLGNLMTAKRNGAPLSMKSIHRLAVQGNLTNMDYQTEQDEIAAEPPLAVDPNIQAKLDADVAVAKAGGKPGAPGGPGGAPLPKDPSNPAPQTGPEN